MNTLKRHRNKFKVCGICADEIPLESDINYCFTCRFRDVISGQNYLSSPVSPRCENACNVKCKDIRAVFTCGHYQCSQTTMTINRCICCGCDEPNEQLKNETHNCLVECGIITN